ncbi:MAG: hypothetical protein K6D96_01970 [Acetatifactor sp.]|nr:hypothetical protein [Acetatifactor sp.]
MLKRKIRDMLVRHNREVCVYGFGKNGVRTFWLLREYGCFEDCFADRDEYKQHIDIPGIRCISYEKLLEKDRNILLVVSIGDGKELVRSFKKLGFSNVCSLRQVEKALKKSKQKRFKKVYDINEAIELKKKVENWLLFKKEIVIEEFFEED